MIVRDCCGCCTEWEQEIYLYLDNELSSSGRERVERHLEKCDRCSRFCRVSEQEEQLLAGRLRHQAEFDFLQEAIADCVMDGIPVLQPKTLVQRVVELGCRTAHFFYDQNHRHYALAASLMICVAGILAAMNMEVPEDHRIQIKRNSTYYPANVMDPILVSLNGGETFEFPYDGSVIYASKDTIFTILSYPKKENDSYNIGVDRRLNLISGELFVEVKPSPTKEGFSIVNANSEIRVYGTQFYVSVKRDPIKVTTVAVSRGQVIVDKRGEQRGSTILKAREMTQVVTGRNNQNSLANPKQINSNTLRRLNKFNDFLDHRDPQRFIPFGSILDETILKDDEETDPFTRIKNLP